MPQITIDSARFRSDDGARLTGTFYMPDYPRAVAVISGATGVPEGFYRHFARWLAEEERIAVLTYTYRDMQDTSPRAMRVSDATMADWAIADGQAARDAARAAFPGLPLWVIGHSLGGMMVSKQPRLDGVSRVITIATGLVYHRDHPMPYRLLVWLFWFVMGPISTRAMGYLPGRTIGLGSTLPARVFWQWRKWCTSPNCFLDDTSLPASDWRSSGAPVRIVGISDDVICPPEMAFRLARVFDGAPVDTVTIEPQRYGLKVLGHFGIFNRAASAVWPDLIADPEARALAGE